MTRRIVLAAFVVLMALVPVLPTPEFWITQLNYIGLYALVVIGLVLLTGIAGLTSFGQAAFVGIGAYTAAYLNVNYAMSPWLTVFVGLALTLASALILAAVTLRMSGHYLRSRPSPGAWRCTTCSAISRRSASTTACWAWRRSRSSASA